MRAAIRLSLAALLATFGPALAAAQTRADRETSRTEAVHAEPGRPESGRPESGRTEPGRAELSRTGPPPLPGKSVTRHALELPDRHIDFTATVEAQRTVEDGAAQYDLVLTAYTVAGQDPRARPVTFVFNGGPGAASAWLQLGALGPWRLPIWDAALAPSAPPALQPNRDTWLDFTDLVFIDPPGTGFSRVVASGEEVRRRVWSVDGDAAVVARAIRRWLAQAGRTVSPKYVVGESYGGIRGPRVVRALQTGEGIGVNGLVLVSPLLAYGGRSDVLDPLSWATHLPSMAAASREAHGPIERAGLADVEAYATGPFLADLLRGLGDRAAVKRIEERVAAFTGLDPRVVREHDGRIDAATFTRERHRDEGEVGSYYDATALAADPFPEMSFSGHPDLISDGLRAPVTSAMLDLYGRELSWLPDAAYEIGNNRVLRDWDLGRNRPESMSALRVALALDKRFRLLVLHGMTDLVTPYFATQLLLNQLPPTVGGDRVTLDVLPGGHMFYARDGSREAFRAAAKAMMTAE